VKPIPIPAHIHYELLLQLLERQTLNAIPRESREQIQSMIVMIRKAIATQRQLEQNLAQQGIAVSYRWSLNEIEQPHLNSDFPIPDLLTKTLLASDRDPLTNGADISQNIGGNQAFEG
jgi:hypothetical protein